MASAAAPQSMASSWRTWGKRRMREARLTKRPSAVAKGAAEVSSSSDSSVVASTWRGPTFSCTRSSAGSVSSAKSSGTRATVRYSYWAIRSSSWVRNSGYAVSRRVKVASVRRSSRHGATASTVVERASRLKSDSSPKKSPRRR